MRGSSGGRLHRGDYNYSFHADTEFPRPRLHDPRREDPRLRLLRTWLHDELRFADFELAPASEDASFRRYFRVTRAGGSLIVMDAPPEKENVAPYLAVAAMLGEIGVHGPRVLERNVEQGFLLLTDLGSTTYLAALADRAQADRLYADAIDALVRIQARGAKHARSLPPYDERLLRFEMSLFPDWFVTKHLGLTLDAAQQRVLGEAVDVLAASALEQPTVFVHRDYHSRNLMVCDGDNPGILDFQDAVHGPLTYDLVSLLRDCYIAWPAARVSAWVREFRAGATAVGVAPGADEAQFVHWLDLMGVQRHLKAIGIFARLWHRDGKPGYLKDIPRTLGYVRDVCAQRAELAGLGALIDDCVAPALAAKQTGTGA
jgi:aminoglycoside/choline kinase family phosphotransferase